MGVTDDPTVIRRPSDEVASATCRDLSRAIDGCELEVWYQPTVRLADAMVTGFEALVRWRHPRLGVLPAAAFLSVAEDCGLVHALDEHVRQVAFSQLAAWQEDAVVGPGFRLAVNVSGLDLAQVGFAADVAAAIGRSGVDPHGVMLELTETVRILDVEAATTGALGLHDLGVALALDDFASQYATFELLHSVPFDVVTIDRAVVAGGDGPIGEAFTRAVADLAQPLAARVVAKGVETPEQANRLRAAGCHDGRGLLWSGAVPAAEAERLLLLGVA